jgi:hypothetical protein
MLHFHRHTFDDKRYQVIWNFCKPDGLWEGVACCRPLRENYLQEERASLNHCCFWLISFPAGLSFGCAIAKSGGE